MKAVAVAVDTIPSPCLPDNDVEGLAIRDSSSGRYLVASAQGVHRAAIKRLDVTAAALPGFPQGMLVMMDDQNTGYIANFKLIDRARLSAELP